MSTCMCLAVSQIGSSVSVHLKNGSMNLRVACTVGLKMNF